MKKTKIHNGTIKHHGLKAWMYSVISEYENHLLILNRITKEVRLIEK